jgi:streptogramin lyase
LNGDDRTLTRVDPESRTVIRTFAVGGTPTDLALAAGSVWVADRFEKALTRVDGESGVVTDTVALPGSGEGVPISLGTGGHVVATHDTVWATMLLEHGFVCRVDGRRNTVAATIRLQPGAGGDEIAVGEGAVWVNGTGV